MIRMICIALLVGVATSNVFSADCSYCNVVLAKDIISEARDTERICQALDIIQESDYEVLIKSGSWSGGIDIIGIVGADAKSTWKEFKEKRSEFFRLQKHTESYTESMRSIRTITSELAYPEWGKCIKGCLEADESKCTAFIQVIREGKQFIELEANYYVGAKCPISVPKVEGILKVINGRVVSESQTPYQFNRRSGYPFSIKKGDAPLRILIERKDSLKETIISLTSKTFTPFSWYSTYKTPPPYTNCTVSLRGLSNVPSEPTFSNWQPGSVQTDELGEAKCKILSGSNWIDNPRCTNLGNRYECNGDFCFSKHEIVLPPLGAGYYYDRYQPLQCTDDGGTGSCAWNADKLNALYYVGRGSAKVTFRAGSSKAVFVWNVAVYKEGVTPTDVVREVKISGSRFVVEVPTDVVNPKIRYINKGNAEDLDLGNNSLDGRLRYLGKTSDNRSYNYIIENSHIATITR